MEIKGKVHCFFEQSGTFKNEFIKLGIPAEDYDIQDNFGETDHIIDLFNEINQAYGGGKSIFDNITKDDLIIAFFPCIYFSCVSQMQFSWTHHNYKNLTIKECTNEILKRSSNREKFLGLMIKLFAICKINGLRLIVENPWAMQTFLKSGFLQPPAYIDNDRTRRGDYYIKPTAYWFVCCDPTEGFTIRPTPANKKKSVIWASKGAYAGFCSEERSMISPDYARNFICDNILGKAQVHTQLSLYDMF